MKNAMPLSEYEKNLLHHCIQEKKPLLLPWLGNLDTLSIDEINELQDAITLELMAKGFNKDSSHNKYGLELEDLIDRLAEIFIWPKEK